tara:strand:+ start:3174 stop:3587 length:414 start_codon:yes stop_codon:yes gene_type:complete
MNLFLYKIAAFFLALVVLFSSVYFTVDKHLCEGHIFSKSFFGKATDCGMKDVSSTTTNTALTSYSKKSCCTNEKSIVNGSKFKKERNLKLNNVNLLSPFLISFYFPFLKLNKRPILKASFLIPFTTNYTILYQVFRI